MSIKTVLELAKKGTQTTWRDLGLYTFITIILVLIVVYCLYHIITIIMVWRSQKGKIEDTTSRSRKRSNNPANPADDNEVYINLADDALDAEVNDEYAKYTSQINQSVAEFKTYNEKLKVYYKENKPGEQPKDIIDTSIVTKDSDDY